MCWNFQTMFFPKKQCVNGKKCLTGKNNRKSRRSVKKAVAGWTSGSSNVLHVFRTKKTSSAKLLFLDLDFLELPLGKFFAGRHQPATHTHDFLESSATLC